MNRASLQQMVVALLESGMTQQQLADKTETNQPQIARIKHGQKSDYELGKRIEDVYQQRIGNTGQTAA